MSYTNGIGSLQQAPSSIASTVTKPVVETATGTTTQATSVREDQADLSSTGGIIAQALEGSDARSAKVSALQQAIASGSYHVPSSDVAEKVIDSLLK